MQSDVVWDKSFSVSDFNFNKPNYELSDVLSSLHYVLVLWVGRMKDKMEIESELNVDHEMALLILSYDFETTFDLKSQYEVLLWCF